MRVVAAAREFARRLLLNGRYPEAMAAAEVGIRIVPQDQELWRVRIKAAGKAGERGLLQAMVDRLIHMAEGLGGDVEPETERLLADLSTGPRFELMLPSCWTPTRLDRGTCDSDRVRLYRPGQSHVVHQSLLNRVCRRAEANRDLLDATHQVDHHH